MKSFSVLDHRLAHARLEMNKYSSKPVPTAVMSAIENLIETIKPVLLEKWDFNDRENPISKALFRQWNNQETYETIK